MKIGHLSLLVLAQLSKRNFNAAGDMFERLLNVPGWLNLGGLESLQERIKSNPNQVELSRAYLDFLLHTSDVSFTHIKLIAKVLELGAQLGEEDRTYERVAAVAGKDTLPPPRFSNSDLLRQFTHLGPKNLRLLAQIKYRGCDSIGRGELVRASLTVASRFDLMFGLLDRLHANSKYPEMPRTDWVREVTQAFALDHVLSDSRALALIASTPGKHLAEVESKQEATIDMDALRRGFPPPQDSKGTLVAIFHGGFLNLNWQAFVAGARNGLIFSLSSGPRIISVEQNPAAALYLGVRAIEDGRSILMAADARVGKRASTITVLNIPVPIADGAPFIAYETGCDTVWLSVERIEERFVPIFVPGPTPRSGEKFNAFRERWFSFYADQLNRTLTGDPRNIALRLQWARLLAATLDRQQMV